jgi:hypothetical protein
MLQEMVQGQKIPIDELFKQDTVIHEGNIRHEAILRVMESLIQLNASILGLEGLDDIKAIAMRWNNTHCSPPLPESEFEKQWNDAVKFVEGKNREEQYQNKKSPSYPELSNNTFYQINEKPEKYIIAYKQKKQLIETVARTKDITVDGKEMKQYYLVHTKTYLTCIPIKITRHKSPLTFLESTAKYTITFVDAAGESYTLSHKTLT